jgi:hypothetical protein
VTTWTMCSIPEIQSALHEARDQTCKIDHLNPCTVQFRPIAGRGRPVLSRIINSKKPAKMAATGSAPARRLCAGEGIERPDPSAQLCARSRCIGRTSRSFATRNSPPIPSASRT